MRACRRNGRIKSAEAAIKWNLAISRRLLPDILSAVFGRRSKPFVATEAIRG
jgi:hypothetical protein